MKPCSIPRKLGAGRVQCEKVVDTQLPLGPWNPEKESWLSLLIMDGAWMGGRVRPEALRRSCSLDLNEEWLGGRLRAGLVSVTGLKQALGNLISFRSLWLLC